MSMIGATHHTVFTPILQACVDRVPGAIGAVFADVDGESVDHVHRQVAKDEMLVLGAHYGVVLNQVQAWLNLFHYGDVEEVILHHEKMDFVLKTIGSGYFLILATRAGVHLATAVREVATAANALRREMY